MVMTEEKRTPGHGEAGKSETPWYGWPAAMRYRTAGEYASLSEESIQRLVDSGKLPRVLIGPTETATRILIWDLDDYLGRPPSRTDLSRWPEGMTYELAARYLELSPTTIRTMSDLRLIPRQAVGPRESSKRISKYRLDEYLRNQACGQRGGSVSWADVTAGGGGDARGGEWGDRSA